jgi:adenine-specific DNA methylase
LTALLPYDEPLDCPAAATFDPPVDDEHLAALGSKFRGNLLFYQSLLKSIPPTDLPEVHQRLLLFLRVFGDPARFAKQKETAQEQGVQLPEPFSRFLSSKRDGTIPEDILQHLNRVSARYLGLPLGEAPVVLDFMAGGGAIPLAAVRYGARVFANELNPVASLVLRATLQYPARHGQGLMPRFEAFARPLQEAVQNRLAGFFPMPPITEWWADVAERAHQRFGSRNVVSIAPDRNAPQKKNTYLWLRTVECPSCRLHIPLSTNLQLNTKGKSEGHVAAFPEVPARGQGNVCTFRIVRKAEWESCCWPLPGFTHWHPRDTTTFKDGRALCPRCGHVMDGDQVKEIARSRPGGLPSQMYAVVSKVPVLLTYKDGSTKTRYLWRFRVPTQADLDAVAAAELELAKLMPRLEALGLLPNEEIAEGEKTKEPRNMGITRFRDFFLPRQLLTNMVILEEIRTASDRARAELPPAEAEAVSVYLAFLLSKVINYNSVNTFWDYTRIKGTQTFSRHDFAFRAAFCEYEGSQEAIQWATPQIIDAYQGLAALIHGGELYLGGDDEDEDGVESGGTNGEFFADDEESGEEVDSSSANAVQAVSGGLRPEIIVPIVTCEDAAALSTPAPGTVHLICVDPPYYNNVQYSELSNFFYVWLKRALGDIPGLAHLFREPLAESNREAVANAARWQQEADRELEAWQTRYDAFYKELTSRKVKVKEAKPQALALAGPKPMTAKELADKFYEDKMASVFRRARQLLHPAGRMVVMFNHKQTWAWRSLGMALIRAGFEIRSSVPIHTEAESSLNIRGLDAARSTVLLLCMPREEVDQPVGNWGTVQGKVAAAARSAAERFQCQGLAGTDLYLSALGPAIRQVAANWPVTDLAGRLVDLVEALDEAYKAVGQWRLGQILADLSKMPDFGEATSSFSAEGADRDTQTLWLWLDTFQGEIAHTDDVRKLAKSLGVDPEVFGKMGLLRKDKETFVLRSPFEVDLRLVALRLKGEVVDRGRGRSSREADVWEERTFPNFVGAAVWNAITLMHGSEEGPRGVEALRRWLVESGYGSQPEFFGAFAVTLHLLERVFSKNPEGNVWHDSASQARRAWNLLLKNWRI